MKTLFDIRSGKEITPDHSLLLEVGKDFCCYAFFHPQQNAIDRLQYISLEEREWEEQFSSVVQAVRENPFRSVAVCSAFPQALLVPNKYFENSTSFLDVIYEEPLAVHLHDKIEDWQIVNVYSLPRKVYDVVQESLPATQYFHVYTPTIKVYNGYIADNQLTVHFSPAYFRVWLKKDMALQLVQTYFYQTPLDVVYYLLKICYEFQLAQNQLHLILSGLVEKESALFAEIHQYFSHVHFAHPPEVGLPHNNHQHYFFTSIYNLAACVS